MYEARAEGNITIAAPLGEITFVGGGNGVQGSSVSVTDLNGEVVSPTIAVTIIDRIPETQGATPVILPGPTIAGPAGPVVPGAQAPGAPGGASVAGATAPASDALFEIDVTEPVVETLAEITPEEDATSEAPADELAGELNNQQIASTSEQSQVNPLFFETPTGVFVAFEDEEEREDLGR